MVCSGPGYKSTTTNLLLSGYQQAVFPGRGTRGACGQRRKDGIPSTKIAAHKLTPLPAICNILIRCYHRRGLRPCERLVSAFPLQYQLIKHIMPRRCASRQTVSRISLPRRPPYHRYYSYMSSQDLHFAMARLQYLHSEGPRLPHNSSLGPDPSASQSQVTSSLLLSIFFVTSQPPKILTLTQPLPANRVQPGP